jgi:hypothetical protein
MRRLAAVQRPPLARGGKSTCARKVVLAPHLMTSAMPQTVTTTNPIAKNEIGLMFFLNSFQV